MFKTKRIFWSQRSSGWHNFNWNAISSHSVVHISASEGEMFPGIGNLADKVFHRRGAAPIFVKNINPHGANGGGVEFFLEIDWRSPLDVVLDITVFDRPESIELI
jgi:hypothetical protein